ncbi:Sigma factor RpoE negative regulatory protein RseB precursor [gamma proteobacterium IMCC1989]|nr:Sigma factor RpoE negative regulatory protein RseB precursor [gamma proteobacterium IMCC1989]
MSLFTFHILVSYLRNTSLIVLLVFIALFPLIVSAQNTQLDPKQDVSAIIDAPASNASAGKEAAKYKEVTIENLLNDVVNANRYYSYKGLLTYEANGSLSTLSLDQRIDSEGDFNRVYQTLAFLNGESRRVLREQELNYCVGGSTRWGLWPSVFSQDELQNSYTISFQGQSRVANRGTLVIYFEPKDEFRYGYRFDIDQQTGLILRSAILEGSNIIERTQFVSLDLSRKQQAVEDSSNYDVSWRVPEVEPCHTEQFESAWDVEWLPKGFTSAGNRITAQGEHVLMFTDGLVSVSVFISSSIYKEVPKVTARRGATIAVMSPLAFDTTKTVAVVGEIPTVTARRMAVSVKSK